LTELQGRTAWCHTFNTDLKIGKSGIEVEALQKALEKEGFYKKGSNSDSFEEELASAVMGFQEKYKDKILNIYGLKYGTGYVGVYTRAELNRLYGCNVACIQASSCSDVATSSITVLSPNGGEKLEAGKIYDIKWAVSGAVDKVIIYLYDFAGTVGTDILAYDIAAYGGQYSWVIPSEMNSGSMLRIAVRDSLFQQQIYGISDNYFSITNARRPF
jgi:hypothetical protein